MKRLFDIALIVLALPLLLPLSIVVALAVRRRLGAPVLFRQARIGKGDRTFELIKFRSMRAQSPEGAALTDEDRLEPFGRRLRSTSLDELPTLFNVLRGDMSLVGPRPLHVRYLPRYSPRQRRRHEVAPGVTGWAQVNGRNSLSWEAKFELDVWYVEHRSLLLDLKILWLTVSRVLRRDGISAEGEATMQEFMGSPEACDPGPDDMGTSCHHSGTSPSNPTAMPVAGSDPRRPPN